MALIKRVFILAVSLFTLIILAGCTSFYGIKSDFEKAGYTYSEEAKQYIDDVMNEFEEKEIIVTPHVFTKGLNIAIILEFESTKELEEQIENSETLKGLLKDFQKSDFVRGNCVLIPIGINVQEMIEIFQGRK